MPMGGITLEFKGIKKWNLFFLSIFYVVGAALWALSKDNDIDSEDARPSSVLPTYSLFIKNQLLDFLTSNFCFI